MSALTSLVDALSPVSSPVIRCQDLGKKFSRTTLQGLRYGLSDALQRLLRIAPRQRLRQHEFWALRAVSFELRPGECLGVIGPNGAGKSTLLKLINGELRPDAGSLERSGRVTSLIRLGQGLQPLLTGRENIYAKCLEFGFSKLETDRLMQQIVTFSGLEKSLDLPVKVYSDGMYARLEFSIATASPVDVLLIDEVLAVGDVAFQMRCLKRLDALKREGTAILFVSHSEMNVRHIADRCLLLEDGEALAVGETELLYRKYYEATGFLDRALAPMGLIPKMPADLSEGVGLMRLSLISEEPSYRLAKTGSPLILRLDLESLYPTRSATLRLQFFSVSGLLLGSLECPLMMAPGAHAWRLTLPFLGLSAGRYRVGGGIVVEGQWCSYQSTLLEILVKEDQPGEGQGLIRLEAALEPLSPS
ncbi:MAG: ABC transporter ATP-binding protein [Gammaproteobacteria bacterium]|nr:ABC transporter ATP-binding protein [Gammaproteobacteria bacterium]